MAGVGKGIVWSAIERFSVQGAQFVLSLIIARLITPEEFGLIAMITIFLAIAQTLVDSGFGNALIQRKDRSDTDFSTVFFFNLVVSIVLYGCLFLSAPLISRFYNEPSLTLITRIVGINIILIGGAVIPKTRMTIVLNFKLQAQLSFISVIIGGIIGVILAFKGFGVWALVIQSLTNNLLQTLLFWSFGSWWPYMTFSWQSFKRLFGFGSKLLISGIIQTIFVNLYSLIIGRFYNPTDVGLYNRSYTISQYPASNLTTIITRVIYPSQCANQDNKDYLETSFLNVIKLSCFIIFPLLAFLGVSSELLVKLILTDKWIESAPLISILCVAYLWLPICTLNNYLILSQGASGTFLKAEILKKVAAVVILIITLKMGLKVLCIGLVAYNLIDLGITIFYTKKYFSLGFIRQLNAILPVFAITIVCSLITFVLSPFKMGDFPKFILVAIVFFSTFSIFSRLFLKNEVLTVKNILYKFLKS